MSLTRSYVRTAREALAAVENLKRVQEQFGLLFGRIERMDRRAIRSQDLVEYGDIEVEAVVPSASTSHQADRQG